MRRDRVGLYVGTVSSTPCGTLRDSQLRCDHYHPSRAWGGFLAGSNQKIKVPSNGLEGIKLIVLFLIQSKIIQ